MIGNQLHISSSESISDQTFVGVRTDERTAVIKKPMSGTGFWTSSWREATQDSAWIEWCRDNDFGHPYDKNWFLLTPKKDVNLYVIDSFRDLQSLLCAYPWEHPKWREYGFRKIVIDFEHLSQDYDGLWLTEKGNEETHLSYPHDLNGWDCESVLWFRWCFTDVQKIAVSEPCLS